jgi:hypothetical protein
MQRASDLVIGCLACGGIFAIGILALPKFMADSNARKAGEGSSTIRAMAAAHAAKPDVTAFRFDLGRGGDAGWKALGLPEDSKWHSYEGWVVGTGLWLVATGNLDKDEALDEWEWSPAVPSPMQLREDYLDEWEEGYYLHYEHGQLGAAANPKWTREERMEIARRRAIYDTSLTARFQIEEIADRQTQHKMRSGNWLPFDAGDPAAFATLGVRPYSKGAQYRYSAVASSGALVVEGVANLDVDPCLDRWVVRPPDRTAAHVSDDVDDRGCGVP